MGFLDYFKKNQEKASKKEKTKRRMQKIRYSGKEGERTFENEKMFSNIQRTGTGSDYEEEIRDSAGRKRKRKWEVKKNNSPLSKRQKVTHGLRVKRYIDTGPFTRESRIEDRKGNEYREDVFSGKLIKVKKRKSEGIFENNTKKKTSKKTTKKKSSSNISEMLFGSNKQKIKSTSKKSTLRNKPKSFSNAESLWGNVDSSKPVRKKTKIKSTSKKSKSSSNLDWLLGGSSSKSIGKKSKSSSNVDWLMGGNSSKSSKKRKSRKSSDSIWGSSSSDSIWGTGTKRKKDSFW